MTSHQAAYTVSGIKPQMRAHPDIRRANHNVGIKPKLRAFTDIDPLNHYTFTPQTRAHPDIGHTRISNINGLASAAKAGSCKKCRVIGKYNGRAARELHGYARARHPLHASCRSRDCTHNHYCRHYHRCRAPPPYATSTKRQREIEIEI
jgi:hypothetical protein